MGAFYDIRCPKCNPRQKPRPEPNPDPDELVLDIPDWDMPSGVRLGCGLHYPEVCQSVYQDIRAGKFGKELKRTLFWMRRPAIYCNLAVYVCGDCGRWQTGEEIRLCKLKPGRKEDPGTSLDRQRQARVKVNMKALCYLDEKEYETVWQISYPCRHCGGETHREEAKNLKCHLCGDPMEVRCTGHWD